MRDEKRGAYLVDTRPDAAPVGYCADRDDVDVEDGGAGGVLCETLVYGALEGPEVGLGEPEDVLWFVELDGRGEEHGKIALDPGDELAGGRILWIGVVEERWGEIAGEDAVDKGLELVRVKVVWGGGEEGEGEDKVAEAVPEEGEIEPGEAGAGWCEGGAEVGEGGGVVGGGGGEVVELCAELEEDEGLFEVVGADGGEVGGGHGGRSREAGLRHATGYWVCTLYGPGTCAGWARRAAS